jgi:hypothetical protein
MPLRLPLFLGIIALSAPSILLRAQSMMLTTQPAPFGGVAINRGDFNNDGILDLITVNNAGQAVSVYLGRPDGTFASPLNIIALGGASDLAIGDFNGDGNLDVAIVPQQGAIQILLGNGDGTFQAGEKIQLDGAPVSITAADFDNDGKLDLAVAVLTGPLGNRQSGIEILEGDGAGHFSRVNTLMLSASPLPVEKVRVGDFNNDGKVDLAVLQPQAVSAWFGNGDFTFNQVMLNQYAQALDLTPVDVNQDGFTDILVSFASNVGAVNGGVDGYFGQSSRSLGFRRLIAPAGSFGALRGPVAADVDGDGIDDIVAQGLDQTTMPSTFGLFVWKGNPDGTFRQTPSRFIYAGEPGGEILVTGDFNRDGKIDFATVDLGTSLLQVFLNATPRAPCAKSTANPSTTVCQPQDATFSPSPLPVVAETTSSNPVTGMNVYVDNILRGHFAASSIDQLLSLPDGSHFVTVKAFDSTGAGFRSDRHVTIFNGAPGQTCPTSSQSLSLHICSPDENATLTSPVQVLANAYSPRIITAIQVYIDGNLEFDDSSKTTWVNRLFTLAPGTHFLAVKAFDADGRPVTDTRTFEVR